MFFPVLFIRVSLFTLACLPHLYQCRKSGSPLYKHYKVYKRPQCGQCFHVITVCRLGDNGRMTYFCECCQKGDPSGVDIRQKSSQTFGTLTEKIPPCIRCKGCLKFGQGFAAEMFDTSGTWSIVGQIKAGFMWVLEILKNALILMWCAKGLKCGLVVDRDAFTQI